MRDETLHTKCYGFLTESGEFDCEKITSSGFAFLPPSRFIEADEGRFIDLKLEADWISVSTFIDSKAGKCEENISHVLCAFLDLDGPYKSEDVELPLTDDLIKQRCYLLGLPIPKIIETSPGRFHVKFYFKRPVHIAQKEYLKLVQRALFEAFKDMGPDPVVTQDLTRFLRNEYQRNSVNKKYANKPAVIVREEGQLCTLSQLYHALKRHGFTQLKGQGSKKPRRERQIPFYISQHRIITFLRDNPGVISTYKELFSQCNVKESTGYLLLSGLKKSGKVTVETVRAGQTWKTRFTVKPDALRKEILTLLRPTTDTKKSILSVLGRVSRVGIPSGMRNEGVFMLSLGLKVSGYSEFDTLGMLDAGFSLPGSVGGHLFTAREMRKTVQSAFKDKYRYCVGFKNEKWFRFLKAITNLECEILRQIEPGGEAWQG